MTTNLRVILIVCLFALTHLTALFFDDIQAIPIKKSLRYFPTTIEKWEKVSNRNLDEAVVKMLGVDDYIDFTYTGGNGSQIELYVSYFSAIGLHGEYHSPQNCMPGGGWDILSVERVPIDFHGNRNAKINKMTIGKGAHKRIVYYWYQNRGRIIASEYWDKIYTVYDAITKRRRDGAFIRVMSRSDDDVSNVTFCQKVAMMLTDYLPGSKLA